MTITATMMSTSSRDMAPAFAERGRRCIVLKAMELGKHLDRPVVLVGLMGVGKSTVGRRLAKRLASTRKLLNERAITVWLDAPIDILAERTARRDTRAQLRNGDPKAVLEKLAEERRPSYEEAHIHVKSGDGAHRDVVDAIVRALEDYLRKRAD